MLMSLTNATPAFVGVINSRKFQQTTDSSRYGLQMRAEIAFLSGVDGFLQLFSFHERQQGYLDDLTLECVTEVCGDNDQPQRFYANSISRLFEVHNYKPTQPSRKQV